MKNDESIQTILGIRCLDSMAIFSLITDNSDVTKEAYFHYVKNKAIREYESDSSLVINSDEESGVWNTVMIAVWGGSIIFFWFVGWGTGRYHA